MTVSDWIGIANVVALIFGPAGIALIGFFHKQNANRWRWLENEIHSMKKRHRKHRSRIMQLERSLRTNGCPALTGSNSGT